MHIVPSERLSDLLAPWCQDLLNSPDSTNISTTTRRREPSADRVITNMLISETLRTDTTTRIWQSLHSRHTDALNVSPTFSLLLSLGRGMESHRHVLHGGMCGVIMDQAILVYAFLTAGRTGKTAEIALRYEKSVPLPSVVLCHTVATWKPGRKLWIQASLEVGVGTVFCEAESLWVTEKPTTHERC